MGFRNPFRLQVDENDVAYVTDYSPDSQTPQRGRGPSGIGRMEIVRHPSNFGYPQCYSTKVGYYKWSFQEFAPGTTTVGIPADNPPQPIDCGNPDAFENPSRWTRDGGPGFEPGLRLTPPLSDPAIYYSYRDNNAAAPLGTPCPAIYAPTPGPIAPGSTTECPRLFPELYSRVSPRTVSSSTTTTPPTRARRSSRPTTTTRSSWASSTWTRCGRSSSTRRTASSRSTTRSTAVRRTSPTRCSASSATTRWTCSSVPTARSTC